MLLEPEIIENNLQHGVDRKDYLVFRIITLILLYWRFEICLGTHFIEII